MADDQRSPLETTLAEIRSRLEDHYADRLANLVLYGSVARGTAESESDLDLLVVLSGELDYFRELRTLVELLYPVQLESDRLISALPASLEEFEDGRTRLHRNAAREGVAV